MTLSELVERYYKGLGLNAEYFLKYNVEDIISSALKNYQEKGNIDRLGSLALLI